MTDDNLLAPDERVNRLELANLEVYVALLQAVRRARAELRALRPALAACRRADVAGGGNGLLLEMRGAPGGSRRRPPQAMVQGLGGRAEELAGSGWGLSRRPAPTGTRAVSSSGAPTGARFQTGATGRRA